MLEVACHNIATWCVFDLPRLLCVLLFLYAKQRSDPTPGTTVELGFLGSVLNVELPHTSEQQQMSGTASFQEKYDPKLHVCCVCVFRPPLGVLIDNRSWRRRPPSRLRHCCCSRPACPICGRYGSVWSSANLFLCLAHLRVRPVRRYGGFVTSYDQ